MPALATSYFALVAIMFLALPSRPIQEGLAFSKRLLLGLLLVSVQLPHLFSIGRALPRQGT
jgi:hypothetical protein